MGVSLVTLGFFGFVVGYVSGMFGVGGGFMLTPLLNLVLGVPYPIAVGSGLCQMVGTATSAYLRHANLNQGEPRVGWLMLGGSLCGVYVGADLLDYLASLGDWTLFGKALPAVKLALQPTYALALLAITGVMLSEARRGTPAEGEVDESRAVPNAPLTRIALPPFVNLKQVGLTGVSVPVLAYLGLALGFLSGLLGIGGGILLMPALIYGLGFPIRQAAGTGILVLIFAAAFGTVKHALAGNVDLGIALPLLVGSSIGAQLGAVTTARLGARQLRGYFALLVLATVLALLFDLARSLIG